MQGWDKNYRISYQELQLAEAAQVLLGAVECTTSEADPGDAATIRAAVSSGRDSARQIRAQIAAEYDELDAAKNSGDQDKFTSARAEAAERAQREYRRLRHPDETDVFGSAGGHDRLRSEPGLLQKVVQYARLESDHALLVSCWNHGMIIVPWFFELLLMQHRVNWRRFPIVILYFLLYALWNFIRTATSGRPVYKLFDWIGAPGATLALVGGLIVFVVLFYACVFLACTWPETRSESTTLKDTIDDDTDDEFTNVDQDGAREEIENQLSGRHSIVVIDRGNDGPKKDSCPLGRERGSSEGSTSSGDEAVFVITPDSRDSASKF